MVKSSYKFHFEVLFVLLILTFQGNVKVLGEECCEKCVVLCGGNLRCMFECFLHCPFLCKSTYICFS